jgi:hypothetical protein
MTTCTYSFTKKVNDDKENCTVRCLIIYSLHHNATRKIHRNFFPNWPLSAGPTRQSVFITLSECYYQCDLIFMHPCIVDDSTEIPKRCSFVIEFIIPKFTEGSAYFKRPLSRLSGKIFPLSLDNGRLPHGYINQRLQIQFRAPDDERCAARNMLSLQ